MSDGASDHRGCSGPHGCGETCRANEQYMRETRVVSKPFARKSSLSSEVRDKIVTLNALLQELDTLEAAEDLEVGSFTIYFKGNKSSGIGVKIDLNQGQPSEISDQRKQMIPDIKVAVQNALKRVRKELAEMTSGKSRPTHR